MRRIDLQKAEGILGRHDDVVAAWAFGSAKDGSVGDASDLDIGVLFLSRPDLDDRTKLLAELQEALEFENVDLVVLNDTSSILRFEAVSGRLLFSSNEARRAEFVSLTAREYEDDMAMSRRFLDSRVA